MECFADTLLFELVRKNAEQVEIAARAHDFGGFVQRLNLAAGIGNGAIFFVRRGGGENDVGLLSRFRHKHFVDDDEFGFAAAVTERAEMCERIRAHDVERFEAAVLRGFDHLRSGHAGLLRNYCAPKMFEGFARFAIVEMRVAGEAIG